MSTLEILNFTKEDLQADLAIFVENDIGFLNHTFRTFDNSNIHADEDNKTLNYKIHLATNVPINETDNKAKEGLSFRNFCVAHLFN
jgi:hypothetical protein